MRLKGLAMQATIKARDDFLQTVRDAVTPLLPIVDAEHPYSDKKDIEAVLRRSDVWLSPESVRGYDERDFENLEPVTRDALHQSIVKFVMVASKVGTQKPVPLSQIDAALPPFLEIASIARTLLLDEWLGAARALIDQADEWAREEDWPTKRYAWTLTERFLGSYELDRLVYAVMGSQMALIPVGRYTMSPRGSFDLAVMPAYESVMVRRGPSGKWLIDPLPGDNNACRWKHEFFVEASKKLARLG